CSVPRGGCPSAARLVWLASGFSQRHVPSVPLSLGSSLLRWLSPHLFLAVVGRRCRQVKVVALAFSTCSTVAVAMLCFFFQFGSVQLGLNPILYLLRYETGCKGRYRQATVSATLYNCLFGDLYPSSEEAWFLVNFLDSLGPGG
ncbi:hypothetical protein GQ42DRAFT_165261, partial [Ramicandelaber brevisporus]